MALTQGEVFTIARETVISSITNFIRRRAGRQPKFQVLDLIIPTERKIRSVVGGMETSLGTTLWEPLAKNLAVQNGFEVVNEKLKKPSNIPGSLQNTLQILIEGRKSNIDIYTANYCHDKIKEICGNFIHQPIRDFVKAPTGYGVDIWLRKNEINYFFDTKTVQSNVGAYSKCFEQVLTWYAFFYSRFPEEQCTGRIVFPYNPYGDNDFWSKTIGRGWPLEPVNEAWVENEFWDFCSGVENTYCIISNAFQDIHRTGELEEIIKGIFYGE